jgi:hypothetical protein
MNQRGGIDYEDLRGRRDAAYIGYMANDNWDRDSVLWLLEQEHPPGNMRVFTSPCGVRVVVKGMGVETALLGMHHNGLKQALQQVLESGQGLEQADVRCLADFYAMYDVMGPLAKLLEGSPEACRYLADRYTPDDVPQDSELGITEKGVRLARCGDLARSAMAAQAARSALADQS